MAPLLNAKSVGFMPNGFPRLGQGKLLSLTVPTRRIKSKQPITPVTKCRNLMHCSPEWRVFQCNGTSGYFFSEVDTYGESPPLSLSLYIYIPPESQKPHHPPLLALPSLSLSLRGDIPGILRPFHNMKTFNKVIIWAFISASLWLILTTAVAGGARINTSLKVADLMMKGPVPPSAESSCTRIGGGNRDDPCPRSPPSLHH